MNRYSRFISEVLDQLLEKKLLKSISPVELFNDDPKLFHYHLSAITTKKITNGNLKEINTSGISLKSREMALLKCLAESVERLGSSSYDEEALIKPLNNKQIFDLYHLSWDDPMFYKKIRWVRAKNVLSGNEGLIPAQLVYLNYTLGQEPVLALEVNSVGCAGGFDHTSTLLRGVYEVIERDAFLGIFLLQQTPIRINIKKISNPLIQSILLFCRRYNLELCSFDITSDLQIPCFMTMVIDNTGLGPVFTTGIKSHLNPELALLGSIEEAFNTRPWLRKYFYQNKKNMIKTHPGEINSHNERAAFWAAPARMQKISFLFHSKPITWDYKSSFKSSDSQMNHIKNLFYQKKISLYYTNITPSLAPANFCVYRVFIPELQPFYIQEKAKKINYKRINQLANFFGKKSFKINPLPHFLI